MPNLSAQEITIENLAREAGTQRAQLGDAWRSLRVSRDVAMTTIGFALAAIIGLTFGKSQSRGRFRRFLRVYFEAPRLIRAILRFFQ